MTNAVRMTDLSSTFTVAGPVVTGTVLTSSRGPTVWLSPCQHIVQIGHWVANTVYFIALLRERKRLEHVCAALCFDEGVAVDLGRFYWSVEKCPLRGTRDHPRFGHAR